MGAQSGDRIHACIPMKLGSPSAADAIIAGAYAYAHKKFKLQHAVLINGAAISAAAGNFAKVSLMNGSDVVASHSTADGALVADVGKALTIVEAQSVIAKTSTLTVKYEEQEGVKEVSTITCVADVADSLDGTYFVLQDDVGSVAVWIDTDDSGTSAPSHGADRAIEVTTIATGDDAETVAAAIAAALHADSKFSATSSGAVITVTASAVNDLTDVVDGDTGFTFAVATQGVDAVSAALTNAVINLYGFFY